MNKNYRYRNYTDQDIIDAVSSSNSIREVLVKLGLSPAGGNYKILKNNMSRLGLDDSHFKKGQGWSKGKKLGYRPRKQLSEILVENSSASSNHLRARLLRENIFEHKCYRCDRTHWEGEPIPLELEHKNGINTDNRLDNLTLLCPNCHALTPTYRGRNIGQAGLVESGRHDRLKLCCSQERTGSSPVSRTEEESIQNFCVDCSNEISRGATRCITCYDSNRQTKIDWPPVEVILDMLSTMSYVSVGRELGVSDNAIRKHLANHFD